MVKSSTREVLPMSSYVVLGLLSFGQRLTGYEIRQWALGSTRFFWAAPAMSQVYRELERLERRGLVDAADESGDAERSRTTYGLTETGLAELTHWVNDAPYEPPQIRHGAAFRLFLGHLADRDRLVELLSAHREWLDGVLDDLSGVRASIDGDPTFEHAALVAEWGERFFGADRDASVDVVGRLEG